MTVPEASNPRGRIVLVRHGHVEGIAPPRFRGRVDLPLTKRGSRQAEVTRDYLATFARLAVVYTSPLSRCVRTAELIAQQHGSVPKPLPAFVDVDYGTWQGKSFDDVRAAAPEAFSGWLQAPHLVAIPGAETLYEVAARVACVLRMIATQHRKDTVALVGHDSVNRILLLLALELPLSRYWSFHQSPCGVSVLEQHGSSGWIAVSINETTHLRVAGAT